MPGDVTQLLSAIDSGDPKAADELLPLVYEELRRLAAQKMARELPGQTLQATALVHDAWLRLSGNENQCWDNRGHFFAAAAEAMRRILIDRARRRALRRKHELDEGAGLEHANIVQTASDNELIAVNDALDRLARFDPQAANLVKLRYFVGMNMTEAADSLNLPQRTAESLWSYARSWLRTEIDRI
jgi:RNA polymerase sigma factor (TIGR02999 family)